MRNWECSMALTIFHIFFIARNPCCIYMQRNESEVKVLFASFCIFQFTRLPLSTAQVGISYSGLQAWGITSIPEYRYLSVWYLLLLLHYHTIPLLFRMYHVCECECNVLLVLVLLGLIVLSSFFALAIAVALFSAGFFFYHCLLVLFLLSVPSIEVLCHCLFPRCRLVCVTVSHSHRRSKWWGCCAYG